MKMKSYEKFLKTKTPADKELGFTPVWMPDFLFPFQTYLDNWAIRKGRAAIFAECGLGKTPLQLVFSQNVVEYTNRRVLVVAPLAVSPQTILEGKKFGITVKRTKQGELHKGIIITNYERLWRYNPDDFEAIVFDESGILKNFDGKTRKLATDFAAKVKYRLLCTATPAPNDYMELGCSSEALGIMGYASMLGMFFTNDGDTTQQWRLKGHAKKRFWQWMSSWARAVRKPSDLGFKDDGFILPELKILHHVLPTKLRVGFFPKMAKTLTEQRAERKRTLIPRCEKVASLLPKNRPGIAWCHLNVEGDLLTKLIKGAVQVKGSDDDDYKEEMLSAFSKGEIKTLVTKPKIAGFGLNWQICADVSFFPSHSFEQFYQAIRRCWRFGQKNEVNCHMILSEAEEGVLNNMLRKEKQSEEMYAGICKMMAEAVGIKGEIHNGTTNTIDLPEWIK